MKKTLICMIVLAMMLSVMLIPTAAVETSGDILKGTPTVDGTLDEIYTASWSGVVGASDPKLLVTKDYADTDLSGTIYLLHDADYLYICGVVTGDTNIVDSKSVSWATDGVDIWLSSYAIETEVGAYSKLPLSAYGDDLATSGAIGAFDNGLKIDHANSVVAATQNENGYVVEAKIPLATLYYDVEQTAIAISLQINNISAVDTDADGNITGGNASTNAGFFGYQWNKKTGDTGTKLALSDEEAVVAPTWEACPYNDGLHIGICDAEGKCGWCGATGIPAEGFKQIDHKYTGDDEYYHHAKFEITENGHIATRHCEYCDATVVEEERAHNFKDGVCECGAEEAAAPTWEACPYNDGLHIGICDAEGKCGWCGAEGIPAEGFLKVDHKYTGDDEYYKRPTWEVSDEGHIATRHCEYCDATVVEELREHKINEETGLCECGYGATTDEPTEDEPSKTGDIAVSVLAGLMTISAIGAAVVIKKRG